MEFIPVHIFRPDINLIESLLHGLDKLIRMNELQPQINNKFDSLYSNLQIELEQMLSKYMDISVFNDIYKRTTLDLDEEIHTSIFRNAEEAIKAGLN